MNDVVLMSPEKLEDSVTEWDKKIIEMQLTPEEGQKSDWLKCSSWNNKGKDSSLNNSLSNNNFKIWDRNTGEINY